MNKITVDTILDNLKEFVEGLHPVDVSMWLDAAQKLTVLISDVQGELFLAEQEIAKKKLEFIDGGDSVAKAKVRIEASDEFVKARQLEAKIDQVTELIRISKLQARMSSDNIKNY